MTMPTLESELTSAAAPRERLYLSQPWDVTRDISAGQTRTRVGKDVGELEPSELTGEADVKWCSTLENTWQPLK